eukprot:5507095-Prymnesium_polylepis.1
MSPDSPFARSASFGRPVSPPLVGTGDWDRPPAAISRPALREGISKPMTATEYVAYLDHCLSRGLEPADEVVERQIASRNV